MVSLELYSNYYPHNVFKVSLSTGQESIVTFSEKKRTLFNHPNRNCDPPKTILYKVYNGTHDVWKEYVYTKEDCQLQYVMDKFQEVCLCRLPNYPIDKKRESLYLCRNASYPLYNHSASCYNNLKQNISQLIYAAKCLETCETQVYSTKITSAKWPLSGNILSLLRDEYIPLLRQRQIEIKRPIAALKYFEDLVDLVGSVNTGFTNGTGVSPMGKPLIFDNNITRIAWRQKLVDTVNSNFVKLTIKPQSKTVSSVTEQKKYEFINLVSEFGGVSGVFLGWSCMSFVDLLELLYHIHRWIMFKLYFWKLKKKIKSASNIDRNTTVTNSTTSLNVYSPEKK